MKIPVGLALCSLILSACNSHVQPTENGQGASVLEAQSEALLAQDMTAKKSIALTPQASAGDVSIHVNQFAYDARAYKSAVIVLAEGFQAKTFSVHKGGKTIFTAPLMAQDNFNEWGDGKQHYLADFSSVKKTGEYTLSLTAINNVTEQSESHRSYTFSVSENVYFKKSVEEVLSYFKANRYTGLADKNIRIYDTQEYGDVYGGWMDAGGDTGKYLSHLSYANFMNPQQGAIVTWALAKSYQRVPQLYREAGLEKQLLEEALWGADYLHRILDKSGAFYMTVFDQWGYGKERVITAYTGLDGAYTEQWQAAFREGGGIAIAALARAYELSQSLGKALELSGAIAPEQYLRDAERAFWHLDKHNKKYCDDGVENIIDDYTALIAATELYRVTESPDYLTVMQKRVDNLNTRMTDTGWFVSDADKRPYYHAVEAGMPLIALSDFLAFAQEPARIETTKITLKKALDYQMALNTEVTNPFNYARQTFTPYLPLAIDKSDPNKQDGRFGNGYYGEQSTGFFIPHANETGYWWQGESARLASLSAAAIWAGQVNHGSHDQAFGIDEPLGRFAQNQMDWILGRNPFDMCMLYGFGDQNPPYAESGGSMVKGGISNGITGATLSPEGRGITWAEGPDSNNWRWVEQWLQHSTWYLLAVTAMAESEYAVPKVIESSVQGSAKSSVKKEG